MAGKRGRPPLESPKDYMLRVRFNREELEILDECCKALELSRSEVVRKGIEELHKQAKK